MIRVIPFLRQTKCEIGNSRIKRAETLKANPQLWRCETGGG